MSDNCAANDNCTPAECNPCQSECNDMLKEDRSCSPVSYGCGQSYNDRDATAATNGMAFASDDTASTTLGGSAKQYGLGYTRKFSSERLNTQFSPKLGRMQVKRDDWIPVRDSLNEYLADRTMNRSRGGTIGRSSIEPTRRLAAFDGVSASTKKDVYQQAMEVLMSKDEHEPEKTVLDAYIEKQRKYQALCHGKELAISRVQAQITNRDASEESQINQYNVWLAETGKELDYEIAKAYEDWAIDGRKIEVEHWLSVCDNDIPIRVSEFSRETPFFSPVTTKHRYYYDDEEEDEYDQYEIIEPYAVPRFRRRAAILRTKPMWAGQVKRAAYDMYEKKLQYERTIREAYGRQHILPEVSAFIELKETQQEAKPEPEPLQEELPVPAPVETKSELRPEPEPKPEPEPAPEPEPQPILEEEEIPCSYAPVYIEAAEEPEAAVEITEQAPLPEPVQLVEEMLSEPQPEILRESIEAPPAPIVCQHCESIKTTPQPISQPISYPFNLVLDVSNGLPSFKVQPLNSAASDDPIAAKLRDALGSALAGGGGISLPAPFSHPNELLSAFLGSRTTNIDAPKANADATGSD